MNDLLTKKFFIIIITFSIAADSVDAPTNIKPDTHRHEFSKPRVRNKFLILVLN